MQGWSYKKLEARDFRRGIGKGGIELMSHSIQIG